LTSTTPLPQKGVTQPAIGVLVHEELHDESGLQASSVQVFESSQEELVVQTGAMHEFEQQIFPMEQLLSCVHPGAGGWQVTLHGSLSLAIWFG
jgi:hypothetical protein